MHVRYRRVAPSNQRVLHHFREHLLYAPISVLGFESIAAVFVILRNLSSTKVALLQKESVPHPCYDARIIIIIIMRACVCVCERERVCSLPISIGN